MHSKASFRKISSVYMKGGGKMGLKIMGIRYLGYGKVTANEKVLGISFVSVDSN